MRTLAATLALFGLLAPAGCLLLAGHEGPFLCDSDRDCTGGEVCRVMSGRAICTTPDVCAWNGDCGANQVCVSERCIDIQCTEADLSACAGHKCNASTSQCETACLSYQDCTVNFDCVENVCVRKTCDPAQPGTCDGFACINGLCATSCTAGGAGCDGALDCINGRCACDAYKTGQCNGFDCRNGGCLTVCYNPVDCEYPLDCQDGKCVQKTCDPALEGQCDGYLCLQGVCGASCAGAAECEGNLDCNAGRCECDPAKSGQCNGYGCRQHTCLTSCQGESDCDLSLTCKDGACVPTPRCVGTARPCSDSPIGSCSNVDGCTVTESCSGGSFNCSHWSNSCYQCNWYHGCSCDVATGDCTGTGECTSQDSMTCDSLNGCVWGPVCQGTPTPCEQQWTGVCEDTPGCSVE